MNRGSESLAVSNVNSIRQKLTLCGVSLLCLLSRISYSKEELVVARGDGNWPPYEMVVDGELTGFHIDLIKAVAEHIDVDVTFKPFPWKRAVKMVASGNVDAISYIAKSPERTEFVYFSEDNVLSGAEHFLVKHKARSDIQYDGLIENLAPYSIVYISGYTLGKSFDEATHIDKNGVKSGELVVQLIAKQRYDLGIVSESDLEGVELPNLMNQIEYLSPAFYSTKVYIGFSKSHELTPVVEEFTTAMRLFKQTDQYKWLKQKYGLK
ncbi:transporter substrate-binding domain-containing protein [Vibrio europaeus]|nr:transporter substrate-binding domain-containing protein [Vibrio europaeus]